MGWSATSSTRSMLGAAISASFLGGLSADILESLQTGATLHHITAGRIFVDESSPEWVGIMVAGLARVYLAPADGPEITVRFVRPGGVVGVAALAGTQHPVSARAVTHSHVLQLDLPRVRAVVEREPTAALAIGRELAARLFDTYDQLATRVLGSVRQRLAGQLLEVIDESVETDGEDHALTLTLTHQQLAEAIGSAREVASRILEAFAGEGMVELHRGSIRLLDPVQLHLVAHSGLHRVMR